MKKRIACLVLSLAVLFGVAAYNGTQAWFATGTAKHQYINSGKMNYLLTGSLIKLEGDAEVLPGLELVEEDLVLENYSNIDTQLRIIIKYTYFNESGELTEAEYNGNDDPDGMLEVSLAPEWQKDSDGYYYYGGKDNVISPEAEDTTAVNTLNDTLPDNEAMKKINLIASMKYSGPKTTIKNSGKIVNVSVLIESKQADYVTWEQLTEVSTDS